MLSHGKELELEPASSLCESNVLKSNLSLARACMSRILFIRTRTKDKYKYITRQDAKEKREVKAFFSSQIGTRNKQRRFGNCAEFNLGIFQSVLEFNRLSLKGGYECDAKTFADVRRVHTLGNHFVQTETKKQKHN